MEPAARSTDKRIVPAEELHLMNVPASHLLQVFNAERPTLDWRHAGANNGRSYGLQCVRLRPGVRGWQHYRRW